MQYSEKELSKLIEDVEKEFTVHLAKAEDAFRAKSDSESSASGVDGSTPLAKAEDDKPAEAKEKKEDKEEPKSEEKPDAAPEAPAAEAPEGDAEAAPADAEMPAPGAEDAHGYDAEDLAHLEQMYGSMSRAELMAHHDAVKHCLDAMGMDDAAPAAEAPMDQPAAPAEAAPEAPAPMQKSEKTEAPAEVALLKTELDAQKAKSDELKKNLDAVSDFLTKLVNKKVAPAGKAITNLETVAKSESLQEEKPLTKSEIDSILLQKTADPSLKKSDRDLINAFYLSSGSINSISHLLKK